jgi:phosphopentomutase
MKRAIIIVIDALGVGALPDAADYGDSPECNTLGNVARANNGLHLPNLGSMGLGNIIPVQGVPPVLQPTASYGRMAEASKGKDTTTGHWEIAGLVLDQPFRVYPNGFPYELLDQFVNESGCGGILANRPASGTEIIELYDAEHVATGFPIIYTSADSVFQIACNVDVVPLPKLYEWCEIARRILTEEYNVSRVIARPYHRTEAGLKRLNGERRDLAVTPPRPTILNRIADAGGRVLGIGKIVDIFVGSGITHAVHTSGNAEGLALTIQALRQTLPLTPLRQPEIDFDAATFELIFTNLVDTDALYGHRNDPIGYAKALEEIDQAIPSILNSLTLNDLLIITGDHGCDPTVPGTDHTREYVPLLVMSPGQPAVALGTVSSFAWIAEAIERWLLA